MIYSQAGQPPFHLYCYANSSFFRKDASEDKLEPVIWFGLVSIPGRAWGCTVLTEEGAIYRNLPPHAIAFTADAEAWSLEQAQHWNCYGREFSTIEYRTLGELPLVAKVLGSGDFCGRYLFTAIPVGDQYSDEPEQSKEFVFAALDNGRLTIQPTNHVLVVDPSFTTGAKWPQDLKVQKEIYQVKEG